MSNQNESNMITIEELASSAGELHTKLLTREGLPPLPFWLMVGDSSFQINEANRDAVCLGMLLQMTARDHCGR